MIEDERPKTESKVEPPFDLLENVPQLAYAVEDGLPGDPQIFTKNIVDDEGIISKQRFIHFLDKNKKPIHKHKNGKEVDIEFSVEDAENTRAWVDKYAKAHPTIYFNYLSRKNINVLPDPHLISGNLVRVEELFALTSPE